MLSRKIIFSLTFLFAFALFTACGKSSSNTGAPAYTVAYAPGTGMNAPKEGKTTFQPVIRPGKYSITVRTTGCPGQLHYSKNVKGGTVGLPTFICRHK